MWTLLGVCCFDLLLGLIVVVGCLVGVVTSFSLVIRPVLLLRFAFVVVRSVGVRCLLLSRWLVVVYC